MRRLLLALLLGLPGLVAAAPPKLVASIAPLHSLASSVMAGVATPELLLPPGSSPHAYALRPSDARALSEASIVLWVGPGLEAFLVKPLGKLAGNARLVTAAELPGMTLLPATEDGHDHDQGPGYDGHLWLDPTNAGRIADALADRLSELDPANAARYRANAQALNARLAELDRATAEALAPVKAVPYASFHDAYRYFERRYGLHSLGTVTLDPERPAGARHLAEFRRRLIEARARCVFREPQFAPGLVTALVRGTDIRVGVLDPIGADIPPGPEAYFTLMEGMRNNLLACLAGSAR